MAEQFNQSPAPTKTEFDSLNEQVAALNSKIGVYEDITSSIGHSPFCTITDMKAVRISNIVVATCRATAPDANYGILQNLPKSSCTVAEINNRAYIEKGTKTLLANSALTDSAITIIYIAQD